jgi:hypothetical protein
MPATDLAAMGSRSLGESPLVDRIRIGLLLEEAKKEEKKATSELKTAETQLKKAKERNPTPTSSDSDPNSNPDLQQLTDEVQQLTTEVQNIAKWKEVRTPALQQTARSLYSLSVCFPSLYCVGQDGKTGLNAFATGRLAKFFRPITKAPDEHLAPGGKWLYELMWCYEKRLWQYHTGELDLREMKAEWSELEAADVRLREKIDELMTAESSGGASGGVSGSESGSARRVDSQRLELENTGLGVENTRLEVENKHQLGIKNKTHTHTPCCANNYSRTSSLLSSPLTAGLGVPLGWWHPVRWRALRASWRQNACGSRIQAIASEVGTK